ncbi:hypothetical protein EVAR_15126_1 [Eumeta japonica]|uniref:Uncharacterized protein n=1 Tax=Eumeta variegata TaxID=151549 RepID=A0A4C1UJG1_EUMVA|nr:hypothetical protein EVAR_15126_1 [Eumeta japonica]
MLRQLEKIRISEIRNPFVRPTGDSEKGALFAEPPRNQKTVLYLVGNTFLYKTFTGPLLTTDAILFFFSPFAAEKIPFYLHLKRCTAMPSQAVTGAVFHGTQILWYLVSNTCDATSQR